jgi:hypothetical protein
MKRNLLVLATAFLISMATGCLHHGVHKGEAHGGFAGTGGPGGMSHLGGGAACGHGCSGCASCGGHGHACGHCANGGGGCHNGNCSYEGTPGLLGGVFHGALQEAMWQNRGWRHVPRETGPAGPPTGTYAYPYYTLRGPRDFLVDNPPSIGY